MARNQDRIVPFEEGRVSGYPGRESQMRRDNDTVKSPKITLYDVDYAMMYEIGENMKIKVPEKGRMIDVPVIYADSETWTQIRARGYVRDAKRKAMAPIIAIRRTSVDPDDRLPLLDLNQYVSRRRFYPYKSRSNQYDRFGDQVIRQPENEFYYVDLPTYVRVNYDVVIWTNLIEQLNIVYQILLAQSNHVWGDAYSFRVFVGSMSMNTSTNSGEDRIVSATVSLVVDGYLREEFEYHEPTLNKAFSIKKVRFDNEQEELDVYIEPPFFADASTHISQEPFHIMNKVKKRNLRYR